MVQCGLFKQRLDVLQQPKSLLRRRMKVAKRGSLHQRRVALEQRFHQCRQLYDTFDWVGHTTPNSERHTLGTGPGGLKQPRLAQAGSTLDEHYRADS